jgi:hypothetical protein
MTAITIGNPKWLSVRQGAFIQREFQPTLDLTVAYRSVNSLVLHERKITG